MDANIPDTCKNTIETFTKSNNFVLESDSWNVGDLKKRESTISSPFGGSGTTFEGSDIEKERYDLIMNIYWKINEYNEYVDYFTVLDNKKYIKCVMSNIGTTFDEDINIKLIAKKGYICNVDDIPVPEINIISNYSGIPNRPGFMVGLDHHPYV